jgi:hypothetical protein
MNRPHPTPLRRAVPALLVLACLSLLLASASPALAAEGVTYTKQTKQEYESQLANAEIQSAEFNKRARNLHLTLKDGRHVFVHYGKGEEPKLLGELKAKGISVTILTPTQAKAEIAKKPVHHKLRYIAGGILIAVIVIVGIVLLVDRRRKRAAE